MRNTILIVDDEADIVSTLRIVLSKVTQAEGLMKGYQYTELAVCWCPFVVCTSENRL